MKTEMKLTSLLTLSLMLLTSLSLSKAEAGAQPEWAIWCDEATGPLVDALDKAQEAYLDGESDDDLQAIKIYENALAQAQKHPDRNHGPVTLRHIRFISRLAQAIKPHLDAGTYSHFLQKAIQRVLGESNGFDRPYYIPYHLKMMSFQSYEAEYVEFAQRQIRLVLDECAISYNVNDVRPICGLQGFFAASRLVADFVVAELNDNLFANALSCTLLRLQRVSARIAGYSNGTQRIKKDYELKYVYMTLDRAARSMRTCGGDEP